uniref:Uncharacterized protein n=2 Tax=Vibrionaceae TaxID=641 RepID=A0A0H3ZKN8_VIBSP|nr:hypothetical protein [Vibrio splendidus]AKN40568.1 hypothetical protein [Enterovibrio norvegicus]
MFEVQQEVSFFMPDSVKQSGVILERIERETGVVYSVQLEGSDETMIVNESQIEKQFKTKFSNGKHFVNVCTIGELKAVLAELDDELTIEQGFSDSVDVMLFCNSHGEPHLAFEDGDSN